MTDKLPPHNLEAEQGVLGSILLDNGVIYDVFPLLRPEHFYRDAHQVVYRGMRELNHAGKPIDLITLEEQLSSRGQLAKAGGTEYLLEVLAGVPHSANAAYYAGLVVDKAIARDIIEASEATSRDGYSGAFSHSELLAEGQARLASVAQGTPTPSVRMLSELAPEVEPRYEARRGRAVLGVPTWLRDLDEMTLGWQDEDLIIIAARPSMGKTAIAQQFAVTAATPRGDWPGRPVYFRSIEMGAEGIVDRLAITEARIDGWKLRRGTLSDFDRRELSAAVRRLSGLPIAIDDTPRRPVEQVVDEARRMKARGGLGLVVVDYLQLIPGSGSHGRREENRQQELTHISASLKGLARQLGVPVIALSQLNRQVENRDDRRPRMADIRESGAIEQDADVVMLLHRPDYYDPKDQPGVAELIVAKHRNGPTGTVKLVFAKDRGRFDGLSAEDGPPPAAPGAGHAPVDDLFAGEDWTQFP